MGCAPGFDASFIQLGEAQLRYDETDWKRELAVLRDIGVRSVVLQFSGDEHGSYDARHPGSTPVRALLRAAGASGMDVFVGLYAEPDWPERYDAGKRLPAPLGERAGRAWLKKLGQEQAFAGFYIPHEIDEQTWGTPAGTRALASFLKRSAQQLRRIQPHKPIAIAPFYAESRSPEAYATFVGHVLAGRPVDILMLQDGAGARRTPEPVIAQLLAALRPVLDRQRVELWSVVELFRQLGGSPVDDGEFRAVPDDLARICDSMTAERPLVRRMIAFSVLDYMHPARGDAHARLYEAYRRAHGR